MIAATLFKEMARDGVAWRESGLAPLARTVFAPPPVLPLFTPPPPWTDCAARLVFLNGAFVSALSRVEEGLFRFTATPKGVSIDIPASVCLATQPVELYFHNAPDAQPREAATRLSVRLAAGARATLVVRHDNTGEGAPFVHAVTTDVRLGAGAKLVWGKWVSGGAGACLFERLDADLSDDAFFDHVGFLAGGRFAHQKLNVALSGAHATAHLSGAMMPGRDERAGTETGVRHKGPRGESRQLYKTVLSANARGLFQGRILVDKGADGTDANQTAHALLLSDRAQMFATPTLEIYADDVACSHGNTIGDLDAEALFYLRSRGLAEESARQMLVRAFLREGVEGASAPVLRDALDAALTRRLAVLFGREDA